MFDWLKFFPLAERDDQKPSEVRGPYLSTPRKRKWLLGDNTLHFSAPRANPVFSFFQRGRRLDALSPGSANILTTEWKDVDGLSDAPYEWDKTLFYSNTWFFVGPRFTGVQALTLTLHKILGSEASRAVFIESHGHFLRRA